MRLLLDTHIWLWFQLEPDQIGFRLRSVLNRLEEPPWLSPVSLWEAHLLADRGRIHLDGDPLLWIDRALKAVPVREAALTFDVAKASRSLDLATRDPADRFLAATALVFDLTLVTADAHLLRCPDIAVMPNS